ncbi:MULTISPECIES: hypothetical protein [Olivibacter]|uniref:Uncharacterized protein n=3 Tax=Sphingobacteriaceae TaxID=84566 RepID=F4C6F6_SPHS2|nr:MULTISPECIES: hypothetical protein [Olivibacter]MCL4638738.1 hypothetical protein [Olivibacter sp. UJ_SKK_5.1]MDM8173916.1 hypothetical protein [Olivibacter sp. 47]MDX3915100.1 hypothetical protein [Pseudosphingobacterium sp.]QEL03702.1 hypothetical protein FKG96_23660 [Olivibacter sp. LS-1]
MSKLNADWFIEIPLDFEYKKYHLLAYLKEINHHFHKNRLYPNLNDLVFHYNNLQKFKKDKTTLQDSFPVRLTHADTEAVKLTYEKLVNDDELMMEIERIISYAIVKLGSVLKEGKEIYDFVESRLTIESIGVMPLYPYNGYMLLKNGDEKGILVYEYQVTLFEGKDEKYRGVHMHYVTKYDRHFLYGTPESIRKDLIHKRKKLPNPAVYHVESDITFPLDQTLLPLAKRTLMKHIS